MHRQLLNDITCAAPGLLIGSYADAQLLCELCGATTQRVGSQPGWGRLPPALCAKQQGPVAGKAVYRGVQVQGRATGRRRTHCIVVSWLCSSSVDRSSVASRGRLRCRPLPKVALKGCKRQVCVNRCTAERGCSVTKQYIAE